MTKKIALYEKLGLRDEAEVRPKGKIIVRDPITGEVIFKKSNKIIIHGSIYTAQKHFPELPILNSTVTYNEILNLDKNNLIGDINKERIVLFSCGIDGCGIDQHQVKVVEYSKWCPPDSLLPFRYVNKSNDDVNRDIYFGKKTNPDDMVAYYFKRFDSEPQWTQRYVSDGAPVESNVYDSARVDEIESFVEIKLRVSNDDFVEYFDETTGINNTKINTISLLTAIPEEIDGHIYYQDIRPLTKVNFPNQTLSELNRGLDITYHIYY